MLLKITEVNLWEKEKWSYILSIENMDASQLDTLLSFIRLAQENFSKNRDKTMPVQAISNYWYSFYDSLENNVLVRANQRLNLGNGTSYNLSFNDRRDRKISIRKLNKARDEMRDNGKNLLYKNVDYIFLKI